MMINPDLALALFHYRQRELVKQAETARLLAGRRGRGASLEDRFLRRTGDLLIAIGRLLKGPDVAHDTVHGYHRAPKAQAGDRRAARGLGHLRRRVAE